MALNRTLKNEETQLRKRTFVRRKSRNYDMELLRKIPRLVLEQLVVQVAREFVKVYSENKI